jgi:hypothetical protein
VAKHLEKEGHGVEFIDYRPSPDGKTATSLRLLRQHSFDFIRNSLLKMITPPSEASG